MGKDEFTMKIMEVFLLLFCHFESLLVYRNMYFKLLRSSPLILLLRNCIFLLFFSLYLLLMFSLFLSDTVYLADTSCGKKPTPVCLTEDSTNSIQGLVPISRIIHKKKKITLLFTVSFEPLCFCLTFLQENPLGFPSEKKGFQELHYRLQYFQKKRQIFH